MSYTMSLGDAPSLATAWCSPSHPMGTCKPQAGIAKPMTLEALNAIKSFQGQLNRLAQVKSLSKIAVDGEIGPATLSLYQKTGTFPSYADVDGLAANVLIGAATAAVKSLADSAGAPATVSPPILSTIIPKPTPKVNADGTLDQSGGDLVSTITGYLQGPVGIAAIGGLGFLAWKMSKKRRR